MGIVVAATCMSHSPGMTGFPERAVQDQRDDILGRVSQVAAAIAESRPDAVVVVSAEHFTNFFLSNLPTFAVGMASSYDMPANDTFAHFLRIPRCRYPGHGELGRIIHRSLLDANFDPASLAGGYGFDEGLAVPLALAIGPSQVPVVPIIVNAVQAPYPPLRRCFALGEAIGAIIAEQDVADRVAVIGSGGLSHWVGLPAAGTIDQDFDKLVLRAFAEGEGERLCELTDDQIEAAGNGAHEIRAWIVAAGIVGRVPFDTLSYQPIPGWLTGTAVAHATSIR
jgi:aromatic ring-opening dioxygenase catalytic subunit (LigB family)